MFRKKVRRRNLLGEFYFEQARGCMKDFGSLLFCYVVQHAANQRAKDAPRPPGMEFRRVPTFAWTIVWLMFVVGMFSPFLDWEFSAQMQGDTKVRKMSRIFKCLLSEPAFAQNEEEDGENESDEEEEQAEDHHHMHAASEGSSSDGDYKKFALIGDHVDHKLGALKRVEHGALHLGLDLLGVLLVYIPRLWASFEQLVVIGQGSNYGFVLAPNYTNATNASVELSNLFQLSSVNNKALRPVIYNSHWVYVLLVIGQIYFVIRISLVTICVLRNWRFMYESVTVDNKLGSEISVVSRMKFKNIVVEKFHKWLRDSEQSTTYYQDEALRMERLNPFKIGDLVRWTKHHNRFLPEGHKGRVRAYDEFGNVEVEFLKQDQDVDALAPTSPKSPRRASAKEPFFYPNGKEGFTVIRGPGALAGQYSAAGYANGKHKFNNARTGAIMSFTVGEHRGWQLCSEKGEEGARWRYSSSRYADQDGPWSEDNEMRGESWRMVSAPAEALLPSDLTLSFTGEWLAPSRERTLHDIVLEPIATRNLGLSISWCTGWGAHADVCRSERRRSDYALRVLKGGAQHLVPVETLR